VGVLRGELELPLGAEPSEPFIVRIEPSRLLAGNGRADTRELTLPTGTREFRFDDLPLAAYDVSADGPGWFSTRQSIGLSGGAPEALVLLAMRASGYLEGRVLDAEGGFVEAVAVVLESTAPRMRVEVKTRADGAFRFADLVDGEYSLTLGAPEHPLAPPKRISFRVPAMDVGTLRVPVLHPLRVRVEDILGRGVPGARVRGLGNAGGVVDGTTDGAGELIVPLLSAGRYRLRAEHVDFGRGLAIADLEFSGNEAPTVTIELRP